MTDPPPLVERLRAFHERHPEFSHGQMAEEAADEIERLTDRNDVLASDLAILEMERDRLRAALERIEAYSPGTFRPLADEVAIWQIANQARRGADGIIPPLPIPEDRGQRYSGIKPSAEYQRGHADALKFCAAEIGRLREALERIISVPPHAPRNARVPTDRDLLAHAHSIAREALRGADETKAAPDPATCEHEWRPVIDVCKDRPCTGSVLGRRCQRCGLFDGTYSGPASKTEGSQK